MVSFCHFIERTNLYFKFLCMFLIIKLNYYLIEKLNSNLNLFTFFKFFPKSCQLGAINIKYCVKLTL